MHTISDETILEILRADTGMALGCTEPIAAALAVVKAREVLGARPERISLKVSGNIYKNGMGVGIPGTDKCGIKVAAALGAVTGSSDKALEVLEGVCDSVAASAVEFVSSGGVDVSIAENVDKLYIEAEVSAGGHTATATVEKTHTNITRATLDGEQVYKAEEKEKSYSMADNGRIEGLSVARLYDFACSVDVERLDDIARGAEANWRIADAGLKKRYGYCLGKMLSAKSRTDSDLMRSSMSKVAAGMALSMQATNEQMLRALVFANLVPIHIKKRIGPLSALCGIVPASIGAACGIAFLKGATLSQIENVIQLIIANISGLFCDGAKASCSMKASVGIAAAYEAVYIAVDNDIAARCDGIIDSDVEHSIDNLSRIAVSAMDYTDHEIIEIMTCK